jgi:hypothetical protein
MARSVQDVKNDLLLLSEEERSAVIDFFNAARDISLESCMQEVCLYGDEEIPQKPLRIYLLSEAG